MYLLQVSFPHLTLKNQTFVQVCLRTLLVLAFALMFFGNSADAQTTYSLTFENLSGQSQLVGSEVEITFRLKVQATGVGVPNVEIELSPRRTEGYSLLRTSPANGRTDPSGALKAIVRIEAVVRSRLFAIPQPESTYGGGAFATLNGHIIDNPTRIVVLPPNSPGLDLNEEDPTPLKADSGTLAVGDTFSQQVWIKNVTDLSAWQMDIAFNPLALEATQVTPANFLADGGYIPFFESTITAGGVSASQARIGQTTENGNTSLTNPSPKGASGTGHLLTIEFTVLEFAEGALGLHNVQLSNSEGRRISYYTVVNPYVVTHQHPREDVNRDGEVNIMDLVAVASLIGQSNPSDARADVNNDGMVNVLDLIAISHHTASWSGPVTAAKKRDDNEWVGAAPTARVADISAETIRGWIDLAQTEDDGSILFDRGIANLQRLLASEVPSETRLLVNYPNPFNPETWIPYQLAEAAEVSLTIYSVNGELVRTLSLGHQPAGLYQNRSQAAYWDGRTELGTQVASGMYFYTLKAGDFSSTRKMIVRK